MTIFNSATIRTLDIKHALSIGEAMALSGLARAWQPLMIEGEALPEDKATPVLSNILLDDKVKFLDKELDNDRFTTLFEEVESAIFGGTDLIIKSGNHSVVGYLIARVFGVELPELPYKVVSREFAELYELRDNTQHSLSKDLDAKRKRLIAVDLYTQGKIARESDLMKVHGYKKGIAMNAFNTAKLVVDEGLPIDLVMQVTSQTALSSLAKDPEVNEAKVKAFIVDAPKKALTKGDRVKLIKDTVVTHSLLVGLLKAENDGNMDNVINYLTQIEAFLPKEVTEDTDQPEVVAEAPAKSKKSKKKN